MRDRSSTYEDQATRLRRITRLVPVQVSSPHLRHDQPVAEVPVMPPEGVELALIVGVRLFHASREVVVTNICLDGRPLVRGPFDAAAYALETPMEPLEPTAFAQFGPEDPSHDPTYRGESLRFVAVDWGVISQVRPLCIYAKPWGTPAALPQLWGYVVVEPYAPGQFPLGDCDTGGPRG